jgi:predicted lipoprotein with Yx(FWY)xxD motif
MRVLALLVLSLICASVAAAAPTRAQVATRSTSLGSVLVDARGHTLYVFDQDRGTKSACTRSCAASWPAFLTTTKPVALKGVAAAKLGMVKRANGKFQVTFMGHPLYFFASDAKAGDVRGASITHWAAISPSGARLRAGSPKTTPPPTTTDPYDPGGNGY